MIKIEDLKVGSVVMHRFNIDYYHTITRITNNTIHYTNNCNASPSFNIYYYIFTFCNRNYVLLNETACILFGISNEI